MKSDTHEKVEPDAANRATIALPPMVGFRLLRYFTLASLAAFALVATPLLYFEFRESDFFTQMSREQSAFFAQVQDSFAKRHDATAHADLVRVHEAGNVNLTRLFANALWNKDFAPFVAKVQRIPVDQCRAIGDVKDDGGKTVQPREKKACYIGIGKDIMAIPEFQALDAKVFDTMKKSTVFKIKVYDLRGITVYSSEHNQIGEDKLGNGGWESAMAGKPASELTHRDKFSAFEGVVENRDLLSSYLPVLAPRGEKIVGVFEIYSDVTPFLEQIKNSSSRISELSAENRAQVERATAANQEKVDENANLLLAIMLGLLALLYCALFLIVRHGQRIIDRQDFERARTEERLRLQSTALEAAANTIVITDRDGVIRWANAAFSKLTGYAVDEAVGRNSRELIRSGKQDEAFYKKMWDTIMAGRVWQGDIVNRRKDGAFYAEEMTITPVRDPGGDITDFIAIKQDVTERRRAELALTRQKNLYDMLSHTNQTVIRLSGREELFPAVCRVAVEHGHFRFAWVGLISKEDQRVQPVARYGEDAGYVDKVAASTDASDARGRGITGQALRAGKHVVSNDFLNDPATAPWHVAAQRAGVRASAAFVLRQGGTVVGTINLYAGEPGFFTEDVLATLGEMAADVSFALDNFERESARAQSIEVLRQSEARYRELFESNPNPMWVDDLETLRFLAVNDAAVAHYGYSRNEFLAMSIIDIHHPEDVPHLRETIARRTDSGIVEAGIWKHRKKDGTLIDVEITSHELLFSGRRALVVLAHDITERKRAEESLLVAEGQFRGLVEQSIAGIFIIQDGKLAYLNPRFAEILGYGSTDELIGCELLSLTAEENRAAEEDKIRKLVAGGSHSFSDNSTARRKDGQDVVIGWHASRARFRGRPAIIGLMQDISEKKRAEEQINRYVAQLENAFMRTVEVATTIGEMRDPYTAGHERRVAAIAVAIGAELGFDPRRIEGLKVAGYLHDVGKITIPSEILSKPGKLSPVEFQLIKGHAQASFDVLKGVEFPWPVAEIALQHHERLDGSGYPRGLKGDAILLEARILAVADTIEAMSSHRPYRPGFGIEKALAEIERGRGSLFDSAVADACLRLFREKSYVIPN